MHIGPYDIEGTLGEGGMGVVYRARRRETGERAALKTVRLPRPAILASLRREIVRLERLRHPGVVRVVEHGMHEGLPWYAMELVDGATWAQRFRGPKLAKLALTSTRPGSDAQALSIALSRPDPRDSITRDGWGRNGPVTSDDDEPGPPIAPEAIPELCRLARRLCDALAYIHGEGVVHRDLKPENVLLRSDGQPMLVDFGLVVEHSGAAGREVLDVEAIFAGTAAFMAPEQIQGELVDARADVFALGCMLYESLTGRLPFAASIEERRQSWDHKPPPPSSFAPVVPEPLDRLVLEMLERDPRDRIGHAADVAAALDRLSGGDAHAGAIAPRAYVYRSRFAGRIDALETLTERIGALKSGRGGRVLVEGESGSGKTRLILEAVRLAASGLITMIGCECAPVDARGHDPASVAPLSPLRPLLHTVADRCRLGGADVTARILGARLRVLRAIEPALAQVPGAERWPEPPPLPPEAAKHRVLSAMTDTLCALAKEAPVLLLVDDLQWADNLTLELLQHLDPERLGGAPVLLIATRRSEESLPALENLVRAPDLVRLALGRLDEYTVGVLVGDILAVKRAPPELVRFVADRAEGNPFFVNEYLRTAVSEGVLARTASGQWTLADQAPSGGSWAARLEALSLPRTLREIVARRLGALDPQLLDLVTTAAVLGREFDPELLASLCALDEQRFADAMNELLRRQVLVSSIGGRYRFAHDKIREAAAERLGPVEQRTRHRAVAEAYETLGVAPDELATLAHHWAQAEEPRKARIYLAQAGEQALRAGAHHEAAPLFARAIALADESLPADERARLHHRHADALWGLGDTIAGARAAEAALALMRVRVPASTAGVAFALVRQLVQQLWRVLLGAGGVANATAEPLALARAEAAVRLSQCYFAGQRSQAEAMYSILLAANLAERAGPRGPKSVPFAHLGAAAGMIGFDRLARRYFRRARSDADERDDPAAYAAAGIMEASHHYAAGEWDALDACSAKDLEIAAAVGDRPAWEGLMLVAGGAALLRGRLDDGAARLEQVRGSAGARAGHYMSAWATTLLGVHELWAGRTGTALQLADAARREFNGDGGVVVANALAVRAAALALAHDAEAALTAADETLALLARGPVLYFMWPACDALTTALVELWQEADRAGADVTPLRRRAHEARRFARTVGALSAIGRPIASRAAGAIARLEGRARRARSLLDAGAARAATLKLPVIGAQLQLELARVEADPARRGQLYRRAADSARGVGYGLAPARIPELPPELTDESTHP